MIILKWFYVAHSLLVYKSISLSYNRFSILKQKNCHCFYFTSEYIITRLFVSQTRPRPYLFKGDHKYPTLKEDGPIVVLYAEMGTRDFVKFHKILSEKAQKEEIVYVLRHYIQVCN